jgi:hypothetical protein
MNTSFVAIKTARRARPLNKGELDRVRNELDAIAVYAHKSRELLGDTQIGSDADKANMRQTWILQAVKSALHILNQVEE